MSDSDSSRQPLLAGIEAGGTKYVCAVAADPGTLLAKARFPTRNPEETLKKAADFFREAEKNHGPIASLGIGTFGPADIDPNSPTCGKILTTPKPRWSGWNIVQFLRSELSLKCPVVFETDVNAAILAESLCGAGKGHRSVAYITVGTGIGAAFFDEGKLLHGRMHPEVGHIVMPDFDSEFGKNTNICPFHDSCFEGRAAGPAIEARWGIPGQDLPDHHPAWDLEAKYLAAGCVTLTAVWSPDIIIFGGGVPQKNGLIEKVRQEFMQQSGGYWNLPAPENYICLPELGQNAGIAGALELARQALVNS